jgi:thiol:disulfide interchange protein DsbA
MLRLPAALFALVALVTLTDAGAAQNWTEGDSYVRLVPEQRTNVAPGKVEVMEVFSYACPACNSFQPVMERLKKSLPPNAQLVYLPAAFHKEEDWPMFQRAFFTAQVLGIAERTHQAIFDAVWKSGELAVADPSTHRLKDPLPTIEDAARVYAKLTGIKAEEFVKAASSFSVDMKIRSADAQIAAMEVPGTPCIVVNGKYRINMDEVRDPAQLADLVRFLVAKESAH